MKPSIYLVTSSLPGKLFIMPKPSSEWLEDDVKHLNNIGINTLVSLLEPKEAADLKLENEQSICIQNSITFLTFPIQDRNLPSTNSFDRLIKQVVNKLKEGESVAIHCRAGIGRSGVVVSCALTHFGYSAQQAIKLTSTARGVQIPDTQEQKKFIEHYESQVTKKT